MAEITAARINNLQSSIALILGSGSGQNGYGQTVTSASVNNTGDVIEAADINAIYADILAARVHQVGPGDIGIAQVVQNLNTVAESTSTYVSNAGVTTTDPDGFKKGVEDFEALMTQVQTDKALMHSTQSSLEAAIASARTSTWNGLIYHEVAVTFSSIDHRRHFFNTGGELRVTANNTGAAAAKGLDWAALCAEAGIIKIGAETTVSTTGGGTSIGNYGLTCSYQNVYQKVGSGTYSGIYAGNLYTVKVKSDIPTRIVIRVEFNDIVVGGAIDNNVDGRLESTLQTLRADGDVDVVAPSYYNTTTLA